MMNETTNISITLNHMNELQLRDTLRQLNYVTRKKIEGILMENDVRNDVLSTLKEFNRIKLTPDQIEKCVQNFIDGHNYDANASHWGNIKTTIFDVYYGE